MKANYFLCAAGLAVLLSSGCSGQKSQMDFISLDEAKRAALEDAGLAASDVEFTASDLASRSGVDYYQIDFIKEGQTYKYDIDALTGNIIDSSAPHTALDSTPADSLNTGTDSTSADSQNNDTDSTSADSQSAATNDADSLQNTGKNTASDGSQNTEKIGTSASSQNAGKNAASSDAADSQQNRNITPEDAKASALRHAGVSNKDAVFLKCELDYDHGRTLYEIEFFVNGGKEYDYEIDASTGDVLKYDYDTGHTPSQAGSGEKKISEEKAKELALAQVPGASESDIYKFEMDLDDGVMEYEGKIIYSGMEYEFEIDAYSGAIRSWEAEPLD